MTDSGHLLDPEVEGLLQELARDPASTLLRVKRPESIRDLADCGAKVGATQPGLSTLERHLVERYREEVAFLLLRMYWEMFLRDGLFELRRVTAPLRDGSYACKPPARLLRRLQRQRQEIRDYCAALPLAEQVAEATSLFDGETIRPIQLPAASIRLVPGDYARILIGDEHLHSGFPQSAEHIYRRVAAEPRSARGRAWTASRRACVELARRRPDRAQPLFAEAFAASNDLRAELLGWFATSLQAGALAAAREAGGLVEARIDHDAAFVQDWITARREERFLGLWAPTAESEGVRAKLEGSMGAWSDEFFRIFS
jgi:hypothetical protein